MNRRDIGQNIRNIQQQLPLLPVVRPPAPWRLTTSRAVGGLTEVGFGTGSDWLLIVSAQGRGVVDGLTGERLARDAETGSDWWSGGELLALGIGVLAGHQVRMAGLAGGGLPATTYDGWTVNIETFEWPVRSVILKRPTWYEQADAAQGCAVIAREPELRATGFSPTGQCLVVATSSELYLYTRSEGE
ncbi:hypothetical protein [Deinococcus arcticus]|uniref:Uncharacterized protein n=1 Tax=Deinococcus arcticus TaxID=2136176 RepID=A0A2T3WBJ4_9DEIO|nr:hypothetical protein [Deinococcus arcticus]PTA69280.1 hypothetical protein C8263_02785 [Deinococcus arcticus]